MNGYSRMIPDAEGDAARQLQDLRTQLRIVQEETEDMLRALKAQLDAATSDAAQTAKEETAALKTEIASVKSTVDALDARVEALEQANG